MTKKLGSKLASSVRQAKAKQPQKNTPAKKRALKVPSTTPESELPLPPISSTRVWPD